MYLRPPTTSYTLRGLTLGFNYTVNISFGVDFRTFRGGNCYVRYLFGEFSDSIYVETYESGRHTIYALAVYTSTNLQCRTERLIGERELVVQLARFLYIFFYPALSNCNTLYATPVGPRGIPERIRRKLYVYLNTTSTFRSKLLSRDDINQVHEPLYVQA